MLVGVYKKEMTILFHSSSTNKKTMTESCATTESFLVFMSYGKRARNSFENIYQKRFLERCRKVETERKMKTCFIREMEQ